MKRTLLIILGLILIIIGTVLIWNSKQQSESINRQIAGEWTWIDTKLPGNTVHTPEVGHVFVLTITEDSEIKVRGDCNSFFGIAHIFPQNDMYIDNLGGTEMYCPDSQEMVFTGDLLRTTAYTVSENTLELVLEGDIEGYGTMTFERLK